MPVPRHAFVVLGTALAGCSTATVPRAADSEVVLAVAGPPTSGAPSPAAAVVEGPEIRGLRVSGQGPTTLREARGKVVLVHFWATFCEPCRRSLPAWQALRDRFGDDLAVIAVSVDEAEAADETAIAEYAARAGARFPIVWDRRGETARAFEPTKLPMTYLVDRAGRRRLDHGGFVDGDVALVAAKVAKLVEE